MYRNYCMFGTTNQTLVQIVNDENIQNSYILMSDLSKTMREKREKIMIQIR